MVCVKLAVEKEVSVKNSFCWTDSQIALRWIRLRRKEWKIWVQNRVEAIRENVNVENCGFVPTSLNPVGICTRECSVGKLKSCLLWWNGPEFLLGGKEMWPSQEFLLPKNVDLEEKGSREVVSSVNVNFSGSEVRIGNVIHCDRFSSLNKVVRVTGFVLTYVRNLKAFLIGCESLTPFHMIYEKSFSGRSEIDVNDRVKGDDLRVQAKHTEIVFQHFFNCFYKEYMLALLERHVLQTSTRNSKNHVKLRIMEIVIIKDDKPRLLWRKGKINRFLESRNGKVRRAELVVFHPKAKKTCTINRPIQHLVPLEVSDNFEEENDFQIKNGSAKEDARRPRRIAAQNAELIRNLQKHQWPT